MGRTIAGGMLAIVLTWGTTGAIAQDIGPPRSAVTPGDPSSSALGDSPGRSGSVDLGGSEGVGAVIPLGPDASAPRVPRGITQPPEPFATPNRLELAPLFPAQEAESPLAGILGAFPIALLEGPDEGLTIEQAIERVLLLNVELRAQEMEISKARADVLTAGLRGNPLIYADAALIPYGDFGGSAGGPTEYALNLTVPVDLNGKRKRRVEVAVAAQEVTEALFQDAVRLQVDALYTAWIDVLAAQATIRFHEAGLEILAVQKAVTERMFDEGTVDRTEVNNLEIRIDSTELTLLEARETYEDAKRILGAILAIPIDRAETFPIKGRLLGLELPMPPIEAMLDQARANRPDLAAFRLGIRRAQSEVRLARANRLDDVFVTYQPFTAQAGLQPGERSSFSWAVGVAVPVPIFNRNQGNIARAQQTVAQTQAQLESLERQVILEVQRAEAAYGVTLATIGKIEDEILPAARENLDRSLMQAVPGEPTAISSLVAQAAFGDIARQYLDALVRHRRAMFRLNTAVGVRVFP